MEQLSTLGLRDEGRSRQARAQGRHDEARGSTSAAAKKAAKKAPAKKAAKAPAKKASKKAAQRFNIRLTPTMIFPDGRVVPGALESVDILSLLDEGADSPHSKK